MSHTHADELQPYLCFSLIVLPYLHALVSFTPHIDRSCHFTLPWSEGCVILWSSELFNVLSHNVPWIILKMKGKKDDTSFTINQKTQWGRFLFFSIFVNASPKLRTCRVISFSYYSTWFHADWVLLQPWADDYRKSILYFGLFFFNRTCWYFESGRDLHSIPGKTLYVAYSIYRFNKQNGTNHYFNGQGHFWLATI